MLVTANSPKEPNRSANDTYLIAALQDDGFDLRKGAGPVSHCGAVNTAWGRRALGLTQRSLPFKAPQQLGPFLNGADQ